MSAKSARQNRQQLANQPSKCIFCGNTGNMSKQHIWPNWLKNTYTRVNSSHILENYGLNTTNRMPEYFRKSKKQSGHQGTAKVRKICVTCNGGWMSRIENNMKPVFSSLLLNEPIMVDLVDQALLSNWAVMATIVAEYAGSDRVSISETDRSLFYSNQLPPDGWTIWIAKNKGPTYQLQQYRNRKIALPEQLSYFNTGIRPASFNSQLAIFGIGSLIIITCKIPWKGYQIRFEDDVSSKLFQIYPSMGHSIDWSECVSVNDDEINFLFELFKLKVTGGQVF